jgi:hypothetical protein
MWIRVPVCFELLSPMHIGFLPNAAGTVVAPTRPYVPGKNLWGAVTASLFERLIEFLQPAHFAIVGDNLRSSIVFSYFYLADGERIFVPSYEDGELKWGGRNVSDFRSTFLYSRMSTQIAANGAAQDGSLHEIEFIRPCFGSPMTGTRPSLLCGNIWVLRGSTVVNASLQIEGEWPVLFRGKSNLPLLTGLTLRGERNYGFGRVRCTPISETLAKQLEALWPAEFSRFSLKGALLGHSPFAPNMPFKGAVEIVASREYPWHGKKSYELSGLRVSSSGYFFTPGTVIATNVEASLDPLVESSWTPLRFSTNDLRSEALKLNRSPITDCARLVPISCRNRMKNAELR